MSKKLIQILEDKSQFELLRDDFLDSTVDRRTDRKIQKADRLHEYLLQCQSRNNIINFTVTFDPKRHRKHDTYLKSPLYAYQQIKTVLARIHKVDDYENIPKVYFVPEKHTNGYVHIHGQIIFNNEDEKIEDINCRVKLYNSLLGLLKKTCGIAHLTWNDTERESTDVNYPTYYHYVRKDDYHQSEIYYENAWYSNMPKFQYDVKIN